MNRQQEEALRQQAHRLARNVLARRLRMRAHWYDIAMTRQHVRHQRFVRATRRWGVIALVAAVATVATYAVFAP